MNDPELLRTAINRSGLSARAFAVRMAWSNERTIRRYLAGETPLPAAIREGCERVLTMPDANLAQWVRLVE